MKFQSLILIILPSLISAVGVIFLLKQSQESKTYALDKTKICTKFSNTLIICVAVLLCLIVIVTVLFFQDITRMKTPDRTFEFCLGIILFCFFTYLFIIIITTRVYFINGIITKRTLFGTTVINTNDIISIKTNESLQRYTLISINNKKMTLSYYLMGIEKVLRGEFYHLNWDIP